MYKNFIKKVIEYCYNYFNINIQVSKTVKIGLNTKIQKYVMINGQTIIGNNCYIGHSTLITSANIGNYTSIASGVKIGQGEHPINNVSTSSLFITDNVFEKLTEKECIIGNDVWIGANAVILRGITIGNGAIIGAGAVVTKDVPEFSINVGVPAKVIKYRFNKESIKIINDSNYWDKDINEAKYIVNEIEDWFNSSK